MHADWAPRGHLEALVTGSVSTGLGDRGQPGSQGTGPAQQVLPSQVSAMPPGVEARAAARGVEPPAVSGDRVAALPLGHGRVTCYTCHNPHPPELFPKGSELGARATEPRSAAVDLRLDRMELCLACHRK